MNSPQIDGDPSGGARVEYLRAVPLEDLLAWHGLGTQTEGRSLRAKSERHNIVVTGDRWFDNKVGVGGAGAIDLQMHLGGEDFLSACQTLCSKFRPDAVAHRRENFSLGRRRSERLPFATLMARYATRDDTNWPAARAYLVETRRIEPALVDELHAVGSIYANNHRPNPSLVFLHRTECGRVKGATLRDTLHHSAFRPCLGDKLSAWFVVGSHLPDAKAVAAVESPIDALSYYTLFAGGTERLAVVSCSGSSVPASLMAQVFARRQPFVVALDRDGAGERGWRRAWNETADWSGFAISSACPQGKDWNADLVALRPPPVASRQQPAHRHA